MKNIRYFSYLFFICILFVCGLIIMSQPHRFQKWNSIKSIGKYQGNRELKKNYIDIQYFVTNIPYQANSNFTYLVYPKDKYKNAIIEGNGDCSNFSFGGAYYLLKKNIEFEVIHFFIPETFFTFGGHVALRAPYTLRGKKGIGIIDLAGGGVPKFNNTIVDYFDLGNKDKIGDIYFDRINKNASKYYENYYKKEYLNKVQIGFTKSADVIRYFDFIEKVYIPLDNSKIEKMLYDGLAILLGQYYTIYVDEELISSFVFQIYFFKTILFLVRILLLSLTLIAFYELYKNLKKREAIFNENI